MDRLLTERVKALAISEGADLVGIAPVERFKNAPLELSPQGLLPGAQSVIVIAIHYPDAYIELSTDKQIMEADPSINRVTDSVADKLNFIAFRMAKLIEKSNYEVIPIANTCIWRYRPYKNINNCFIPDISHLHAGAAAGLGEIGWAGLLLTPEYGPRQRLTSVITDAILVPTPMYEGPPLCDHCFECVKKCPTQALSKEVKGKNIVNIGGRIFEYANKNKWRCAWVENFELGLELPIPDRVTEEVVLDALMKYGIRGSTTGQGCLKFCLPPHLRYQDAHYCSGPRRKRQFVVVHPYPNGNRIVTEEVKMIAVRKGADVVSITSLDKFKRLSVDLKDFLPDAHCVITIGISIGDSTLSQEIDSTLRFSDIIDRRLSFIELDIARYLERMGYSVTMKTDLQDDSVAEASELESLYKISKIRFSSLITSAPLTTDQNLSQRFLEEKQSVEKKRKNVRKKEMIDNITNQLVAFALSKGADLVGIAPVERLQKIVVALERVVKDGEPYLIAEDKEHLKLNAPFVPELHYERPQVKGPRNYLPKAESVIVMGIHYPNASVARAGKPPAEAVGPYEFAKCESLNQLGDLALDVVHFLNEAGYQSVPTLDLCGLASRTASSVLTLQHPSYSILDATANRFAALAAGLGEIGWHGVILTPQYGTNQRFIAIVTDAILKSTPLYQGLPLCKRCFDCVKACPVGALSKDKKVTLRVDDRIFEFGECDRLRCDWAKRYALVGDEGPKYVGSRTNVMPPEKITFKSLRSALEKLDPLQKSYMGILEKCLVSCRCKCGEVGR